MKFTDEQYAITLLLKLVNDAHMVGLPGPNAADPGRVIAMFDSRRGLLTYSQLGVAIIPATLAYDARRFLTDIGALEPPID